MSKKARKQRGQNSKKQWKCSHGCPNTKTMCEHLEALMPKQSGISHHLDPFIEQKPASEIPIDVEEAEYRFQARLYAYGLETIRVQVLTYRMVYGYNFKEIADMLSIPSRQTAFNIYKTAIEQLRERGFNEQ